MDGGVALLRFERLVMGAVGLTTHALGRAAPGTDLTFPQWRVIVILGESERGARVGEIAGRVGVTVPATSRLLQRLRRRGYVQLTPDEADRRATRASLTDDGRAVRDAIFGMRRRVLEEALATLGPADLAAISVSLGVLAELLERFA